MNSKVTLVTIFVIGLGSTLIGARANVSINAGQWPQGWDDNWQQQPESPWIPLTGFAQLAYGGWLTGDDILPVDSSLSELRLRLETGYDSDSFTFNLKGDALYDQALAKYSLRLREAVFSADLADLLPQRSLDAAPWLSDFAVKAGRQVLSWGTGDFVFVNDLFRKDWQSFFNGREDQYLKAANDAIKLSYFGQEQTGQQINLDLIWQPQFTSDRYLNGSRFSFYHQQLDQIIAPEPNISVDEPRHSTLAARLYFSYRQADIAFYASKGYAGAPLPESAAGNVLYFPKLSSVGASIITPLASGLIKFETAYYGFDSDDASAPPNQSRVLLGYEQEMMPRLTFSGQFYLEQDHHQSAPDNNRDRQVITVALNYRSKDDKWTTRLFGFYSPNQYDSYLRPSVIYRHSDQFNLTLGANIFNGQRSSFFGQFDLNDNAYLRLNYHF